MPHDFRFGPPDEFIDLLRRFRDSWGQGSSITASDFVEYSGQDYPHFTAGQTIEFLWAAAPLRYRGIPEPIDDIRREIAAVVDFTAEEFGIALDDSWKVAADEARFADRWIALHESSLAVWLEELRLELAVLGFHSTIPAADPSDPTGTRLAAQLVPGPLGLSLWSPPAPGEPDSDAVEVMRASPAQSHMAALLEVVGAGIKLTQKGNLRLADGKTLADAMGFGDLFDQNIGGRRFKTQSTSGIAPVELVLRWGRAAGLVRVKHGSLLPTARGRRLGQDPVADWWLLFKSAVLKLRWAHTTPSEYGFWFWAKDVDQFMPAYLRMAAAAAERGLALLIPAEPTWLFIEERWMVDVPPSRVYSEFSFIAHHIQLQLFVPLEMLGAAETSEGAASYSARLTGTGAWAARRLAAELATDPKFKAPDDVIELYRNLE